ncbi:hypothetical protein VTJ04DRAFT_4260 [Mycothermus thermophilus]|uniref:uncharacterized protein n=1 Tax=Humicola insolens TaxID=85995 RepID=UPI00374212FC
MISFKLPIKVRFHASGHPLPKTIGQASLHHCLDRLVPDEVTAFPRHHRRTPQRVCPRQPQGNHPDPNQMNNKAIETHTPIPT